MTTFSYYLSAVQCFHGELTTQATVVTQSPVHSTTNLYTPLKQMFLSRLSCQLLKFRVLVSCSACKSLTLLLSHLTVPNSL